MKLQAIRVDSSGNVTTQEGTLDPNTDSGPVIQAALDWAYGNGVGPYGSTVLVPPGYWRIGSFIERPPYINLSGFGKHATKLFRDEVGNGFDGPLVVAGSSGSGYGYHARADFGSITDMTLHQGVCLSSSQHVIKLGQCENARVERVVISGSKHEGLVSASRGVKVIDCEAYDCGGGSEYRTLTGAAFNVYGIDVELRGLIGAGNGQFAETGGNNVIIADCHARDPVSPYGPILGFNIGSMNWGMYRVRVLNCSTQNIEAALGCGNGNGRMAGFTLDGFECLNGGVFFMGGRINNLVNHPDEGPSVEGSIIQNVNIRWTKPAPGPVIAYATGPYDFGPECGREPLLVKRCRATFEGFPTAYQTQPVYGVIGYAEDAVFDQCDVYGLDEAPSRGDFATSSLGASPTPNPSGRLRAINCRAYRADGSERFFKTMRETPE